MRALLVLSLFAACELPHRYGRELGPLIDGAMPVDVVVGTTTRDIAAGLSLQGDRADETPAFDSVPYHEVYTSAYRIWADVTSLALYQLCVQRDGCAPVDDFDQISYTDAQAYCTKYGGRLPTEAQLERALRGDDGDSLQKSPSPHGVNVAPDNAQEYVSDGYKCDAYVDREYADPIAVDNDEHTRSFALDRPIGPRWHDPAGPRRFRCAFDGPSQQPPMRPTVPRCTGGNCNANKLALGARFGCAIGDDGGRVWCWGLGTHGALGSGRLDAFVPLTGEREVLLGGAAATQLALGDAFGCATTTIDTRCWGANGAGQVGDGAASDRLTPTAIGSPTWTSLTAAGSHACALDAGAVTCWGNGVTTPTAIGVTGATAVEAGPTSDCAITANGVECWGAIYDSSGASVTVTPANRRVFALTTPSQIAVGAAHACAVVAAGTEVRCWGNRVGWGGTGIAADPELVTSGTTLVVTARANQTVITSGSTIVQTTLTMPTGTFDGTSIAIGTTDTAGVCMTSGNTECRGIDVGQLGHGTGCDTSIVQRSFL